MELVNGSIPFSIGIFDIESKKHNNFSYNCINHIIVIDGRGIFCKNSIGKI